jgi:hypothetical protein
MAVLLFNIPDDVAWGDYFYEERVRVVEDVSEGEWEQVGQVKKKVEVKPPPRWCRDGNACEWKNCKFRHERCSHYDNWVRRGKKGMNCRCYATDPESKKRQTEGGCLYDHRDVSKLKMFAEKLPCSSEDELWESFMPLGLEGCCSYLYDMLEMSQFNKALLIRSLIAANVEFDAHDRFLTIYFDD